MAEQKTTRKRISLAFAAPAFVANGWLALAFAAAVAAFAADGWLALALTRAWCVAQAT